MMTQAGLHAQHDERLRALGVAEAALGPGPKTLPRATGEIVRVLQWNILADCLSDDGFLCRDVLPGKTEDAAAIAEEVAAANAAGEDMAPLRERLSSPRAEKNMRAIVDWERRSCRTTECFRWTGCP